MRAWILRHANIQSSKNEGGFIVIWYLLGTGFRISIDSLEKALMLGKIEGRRRRGCHPTISSSRPLLLLLLRLSQHQGLFQWVSSSQQMAKVFKLRVQHQSFHWIFRVDLLAVQGTLKSLFQHHSSKPSILVHTFFLLAFHLYEPHFSHLQN